LLKEQKQADIQKRFVLPNEIEQLKSRIKTHLQQLRLFFLLNMQKTGTAAAVPVFFVFLLFD
jgi:hypothetical protein